MTPWLTAHGLEAAALAVTAVLLAIAYYLSGVRHQKVGQAEGAAKQAGKDRAQAIAEAAKQGPDALAAEGAKVTAELDKELGRKP